MQHKPSGDVDVEEEVPVEELVVGAGPDDEREAEGEAVEGEAAQEEEPVRVPTPDEQIAEWKERAMRAAADLDNFRKRMAREKSEAVRYANQALLEELLPVLDNFEMGLQAAAAEHESMIFRGMEMVKKQMDEFLSRQGVQEVAAEAQVFDPNVHEAVAQEECADTEEGTVLRVMRRGYKMNDRLLRPANVVVAKAPEASAEGEEE